MVSSQMPLASDSPIEPQLRAWHSYDNAPTLVMGSPSALFGSRDRLLGFGLNRLAGPLEKGLPRRGDAKTPLEALARKKLGNARENPLEFRTNRELSLRSTHENCNAIALTPKAIRRC